MRRNLQTYDGRRLRFNGKVATFSKKSGYNGSPQTILIKNIKLHKNQEDVADHVWLETGKWSRSLRPGDQIIFDAKVRLYQKNYRGKRNSTYDYKLVYLSLIHI